MKSKLSLCMIARDEEDNLAGCLLPVKDIFDEIVVVDTGSQDKTVEMGQRLGAKVHSLPWEDDFARARNASLRYATGDWIFWMDADDRLERGEAIKLRRLAKSSPPDSYFLCRVISTEFNGTKTEFLQLRLFPKLPGVRFENPVHEQVSYSLDRLGLKGKISLVRINHLGYSNPEEYNRKVERNLKILQRQVEKSPQDISIRYQLATNYNAKGMIKEAIRELRILLNRAQTDSSFPEITKMAHIILGNNYRKLGRFNLALQHYQRAGEVAPDDGLPNYCLGELFYKLGKITEAEANFEEIKRKGIRLGLASIPLAELRYFTSFYLAKCFDKRGEAQKASQEYKNALQIKPNSLPILRALGELFLRKENYAEAQRSYQKLVAGGSNSPTDYFDLGTAEIFLGDLRGAERALKKAIKLAPNFSEALLRLAFVYTRQGKLRQAEESYKKLLQIDPHQVEPLTNLGYLYLNSNDHAQAKKYFIQVKKLKPGEIDANLGLAKIYAEERSTPSLFNEYSDISARYPKLAPPLSSPGEDLHNLALAFNRFGKALITKKKVAEAAIAFDVSLTLEPDLEPARKNLSALKEKIDFSTTTLTERKPPNSGSAP